MVWIASALGVLAVVGLLVFAFGVPGSRCRLLRAHVREEFVVTLTNGEAFRGLLIGHDRTHLLFDGVKAISGSQWVPADGKMLVPAGNVRYMQTVAGPVS